MSFSADFDLEHFVRRFLISRGAEIEQAGSRFHVLLPHALAGRLGLPDYATFNLAGESEGEPGVQYGTPLLEKMAETAAEGIPFASVRLKFDYLKSQGFDTLIGKQFRFPNSVGRVESFAQTLTDYIVLTCRYLLQSDEQKEDLVTLGFNLETGAPVDDIELFLDGMEKDFEVTSGATAIDADKAARIVQWVQHGVAAVLEPHLSTFRDSMNRRCRRDVGNLEEYYSSLRHEMEAGLLRPGLSADAVEERVEKIALLSDELAVKRDDLFKKYSISVRLRLCAALQLRTPVVKIIHALSVGREKKHLSLFYNPVTRSIDPLLCAGCRGATRQIHFCRRPHPLCPKCAQACPVCG